MRIVLLPGLDGTGDLFARLTEVGFDGRAFTVIGYPPHQRRTYDEDLAQVRDELGRLTGPFVVVAESYSGPIGVRLAADPPPGLVGVVLVATFVTPPLPRWLDHFAKPVLFRRPPPRAVIRHFLAGWRTDVGISDELIEAKKDVAAEVYLHRVRNVLSVDVRAELRTAKVPLSYIKPSRDRLVRTRKKRLLELQPALQWVEVDAPHLVLQTQPEESSRIICEFAESI